MRLLIAPDSFKGSLTAAEAARAIAQGWQGANCIELPMADGGEGSLQSLVDATGGEIRLAVVRGPLGLPVEAQWGVLGDGKSAVIEIAQAAGLPLVPENQRNPMHTTSWGVGELIIAALDAGLRRFIVALGGSATVDGGAGLLMALGATLLTESGEPIEPAGGGLARLATLDLSTLDPRVAESEIWAAVDVDTPLLGPEGAAALFGPQKGASAMQVARLEQGLKRMSHFMSNTDQPGSGAAGGMGAAFAAFLGGELLPGAELIAEVVGLEEKLKGADLVITGEGQIDSQTIHGKTPIGVARCAKQHGLPVIAFAGQLGEGWEAVLEAGIDSCFAISQEARNFDHAAEDLAATAAQVARAVQIGREI